MMNVLKEHSQLKPTHFCITVNAYQHKVGIYENTVVAWRHKTKYLIYKILKHDRVQGLVNLDETFFDCILKGVHQEVENDTAKVKKCGISDDKIGVARATDESNHLILMVIN